MPLQIELLDARIALIGHVEGAVGADGHAGRTTELAWVASGTADLSGNVARRIFDEYAVVAGIGDRAQARTVGSERHAADRPQRCPCTGGAVLLDEQRLQV